MPVKADVGSAILKCSSLSGPVEDGRRWVRSHLFEADDCHGCAGDHDEHAEDEEDVEDLVAKRTLGEPPVRDLSNLE